MIAKVTNWILEDNINTARYDLLNQAQPDTGLSLLESEEYHKWITNHHQTLFLQEPPEVGKTILAAILAEALRKEFDDKDSVGVAAVFCNFTKQHTRITILPFKYIETISPIPWLYTGSCQGPQRVSFYKKNSPQLRRFVECAAIHDRGVIPNFCHYRWIGRVYYK
jgi:hypothetical protein